MKQKLFIKCCKSKKLNGEIWILTKNGNIRNGGLGLFFIEDVEDILEKPKGDSDAIYTFNFSFYEKNKSELEKNVIDNIECMKEETNKGDVYSEFKNSERFTKKTEILIDKKTKDNSWFKKTKKLLTNGVESMMNTECKIIRTK